MYFDKYNLIVTKDGDGGDTAAEVGRLHFWCWVLKNKMGYALDDFPNSTQKDFAEALRHLHLGKGFFRRHPEQYNDPKDFSRDQSIGVEAALGAYEFYDIQFDILWQRFKRFGFYQNRDFASPEHWAFGVRAMRLWVLYPWLALSEISIGLSLYFSNWYYLLLNIVAPGTWQVGGAIVQSIRGFLHYDKPKTTVVADDINTVVVLLQSRLVYPTLFTQLAKMIYSKFRPAWEMVVEVPKDFDGEGVISWHRTWDKSGALYAFERYYRPEAGSNPEIAELVRPILQKYF